MAFDVGGSKGKVRPVMNVTPLVDVVLVLLIIFMVITPLLTKQFRINLPEKPDEKAPPAEPTKEDDGPVVVSVTKDGRIKINKEEVTEAELPTKLSRVLAARSDQSVFFNAEDDVPYGRAIDVLDHSRSGGAAIIAVMTEPLTQ